VARVRTDASDLGATYVAAVGNSGEQHHRSDFTPVVIPDAGAAFSSTVHRFPNGTVRLPVSVEAGGAAIVFLQWDDAPFDGATTDFDLIAFTSTSGNTVAAFSAATQAGRPGDQPTEALLVENTSSSPRTFGLQIEYCGPTSGDRCTAADVPAAGSRTFRVFVVGDGLVPASDRVRAGSIPNGPDAPRIITTGAFCITDGPFCGGDGQVERFSSSGTGVPTDPREVKPTVVGPDGAETTVDEVAGLGGDGLFFGTSAAAPHVAAVAAMIVAASDFAPDAVRRQLQDTARPIGSPPDTLEGWGRVDADAALTGLVDAGGAGAATLAAGATPPDGAAGPAEPGVVLVEAVLTNTHATDLLRLVALGVTAGATSGHERADLARACVEVDGARRGCGLVGDRFDADDGRLLVEFDSPVDLGPGAAVRLRVVYDLAVRPAGTTVTAGLVPAVVGAGALAALVVAGVGRRRGAAVVAALLLAACGGGDGGSPGVAPCPPVLAAAAESLPASAAFTLQPLQPGDVLALRGATVVVPTGGPVSARSVTVPRP
jgi:hypothetical protein